MVFQFATAGQIIFGEGSLKEAGPAAASFGSRALLVSGLGEERTHPLMNLLTGCKVEPVLFTIDGEPTVEVIRQASGFARSEQCDLVIGFGGGSSLDTAKAAAAMLNNPGDVLDYLEVIGKGASLKQPSAPVIAIPTTAGTGSEVTRNAVIASPEHQFKASLRSPSMLPRVAIVDPELTYGLPPEVTASTGLDALTQLIEPFVSVRANPLTDALCRDGIRYAARSLGKAYHNGGDAGARREMALVSLFGGLTLANAGLGAAHGFASPIGGMFPAPHGAVCARLLPGVMDANLNALREARVEPVIEKYAEVARLLTGDPEDTAEDGITWVRHLVQELGIKPLSAYGVTSEDVPEIARRAASASSMKGNPIVLRQEVLEGILREAITEK